MRCDAMRVREGRKEGRRGVCFHDGLHGWLNGIGFISSLRFNTVQHPNTIQLLRRSVE